MTSASTPSSLTCELDFLELLMGLRSADVALSGGIVTVCSVGSKPLVMPKKLALFLESRHVQSRAA
jgi:hypothetical protein